MLEWPVIFVVWLVYRFHVGIAVILYLVLRCGYAQARSDGTGIDRLTLLILGLCALGFVLLPVQDTLVWNICASLRILPHALMSALMGPALCYLVRRLMRRRRVVVVGTSAALGLGFVANAFVLGHKARSETRWPTDIGSEELLSCYRFIESSTPPDAVILQPRRFPESGEVSALTKRRMVLEFGQPWDAFIHLEEIVADVARFYRGVTPAEARSILDRYGVDYVIADLSRSPAPADDSRLTPVFRNGDAVVYRVDRGEGEAPAVAPDGGHLEPQRMGCAARRPGLTARRRGMPEGPPPARDRRPAPH